MLGYLFADIICSEKRTVFGERSSRKTVSFDGQIMFKDKYASIISRQMETIVFIGLLSFKFVLRHAQVWKLCNILGYFSSFSWGIRSRNKFRPIAPQRKYLMDYNYGYAHVWYLLSDSLKVYALIEITPIACWHLHICRCHFSIVVEQWTV